MVFAPTKLAIASAALLISAPSFAQTAGEDFVTATAVSVVPGAIICPTLDRVRVMFDLYIQFQWQQRIAREDPEEYRILHGTPPDAPDFRSFGCTMVPPGTRLRRERTVGGIPVVSSEDLGIKGVTLPSMIDKGQL